MDLACSLAVVAVAVLAGMTYALRVALRGRVRSDRVEREGKSVLVGKTPMEMTHWVLGPVVEACVRYLHEQFGADVESRTVREEHVNFPLPRELRGLTVVA